MNEALIIGLAQKKGWNIYPRGKEGVEVSEGPVCDLQTMTSYVFLPKILKEDNKRAIKIKEFMDKHKVMSATITAPSREAVEENSGETCLSMGRKIINFAPTEEDVILPGERISFIEIELRGDEVKISGPAKVFMPYPVFLEALKTLPDLTRLA